MTNRYPPIVNGFPHLIHGGDYNPEQWKHTPEVWDEDMRLMKLAGCNSLSVGIFSWAALEPEEGVYRFAWLDTIMDKLASNDARVVLATPSAARPQWMAQKYPEVLRVGSNRQRNLFGERHNHCYSSLIYREKVSALNRLLAERYKDHPALGLWHISNEYGGACHCPLCQENFRTWLREKYDDNLTLLNEQWWTGFWSHTYTDWAQIESPAPHGENSVHGLYIDWMRFVTHMTIDFFEHEIKPLREITPNVKVTANLMTDFYDLDYWKLAQHLDVVSWDAYPQWTGNATDQDVAIHAAFNHDGFRAMKGGQPFMLMESTPSTTNWMPRCTLKRPGQHLMASLQAVAHGADTVQYFQWRKSRGSSEKFHGAVVGHCGHENTRVFRDVAEVGQALQKLDELVGTTVDAKVAIIFDRENWWALHHSNGLNNSSGDKGYRKTVLSHYKAFWKRSIAVDVISSEGDFTRYSLVAAPMLYMIKPGVAEKIESFVKDGGTFVGTYWSGIVNENDLCFLGGFPGPLRNIFGVWAEEIDTLPEGMKNTIKLVEEANREGFALNGNIRYDAIDYCELSHLESAKALAVYASDFYENMPALTINRLGKGKAYYIAFKSGDDFLTDFYDQVIKQTGLHNPLHINLPSHVSVQARTDGTSQYIFILNTFPEKAEILLPNGDYYDMLAQQKAPNKLVLPPFGSVVLKAACPGSIIC